MEPSSRNKPWWMEATALFPERLHTQLVGRYHDHAEVDRSRSEFPAVLRQFSTGKAGTRGQFLALLDAWSSPLRFSPANFHPAEGARWWCTGTASLSASRWPPLRAPPWLASQNGPRATTVPGVQWFTLPMQGSSGRFSPTITTGVATERVAAMSTQPGRGSWPPPLHH